MRVRRLIRLALAAVLLVPVCAGVAACVAFDRRPAVARDAEFTPDQIERAKRILASNDPRRMKTGAVRTVAVTASDVDVALNYLAHRYADGSAEARFEPRRLHVRASVRASALPLNPYLNVDVHLVEGSPLPAIERCRVGQLPLPTWFAEAVLFRLAATVTSGDDLAMLRRAVRKVEFAEGGARLTYQWHDELGEAVRAALVPAEARERLRVYQQALQRPRALPKGRVSLAALLTPVFALAAEGGRASDPVAENRAAILVLTFYVDGRSLAQIVPDARSWPRAPRRAVTLNRARRFHEALHDLRSARGQHRRTICRCGRASTRRWPTREAAAGSRSTTSLRIGPAAAWAKWPRDTSRRDGSRRVLACR